jgi:NADPH:quinone reductase-like Zn-dependent oxidoreductase
MKAVRLHDYGGLTSVRVDDIPVPAPAAGEVLVRVRAASVNPVNWKMAEGFLKGYLDVPLPVILGCDLAGTVEAVGEGVAGLSVGEAVYGGNGITGTFAEYALVPAGQLAAKPKSLDFIHAAAAALVGITGWQGLFDVGKLQPGERVLIHAGAGGIGHLAVQFAKQRGAHVIATASAGNLDFVRSLGADEVIDYRARPFEEQVQAVDLVLDLVGGETLNRSHAVLRPGGRLVCAAPTAMAETLAARSLFVMAAPNSAQYAEMARLIDEAGLKVTVSSVLPLADAVAALELIKPGHTRGKVVLSVG